jgi:uncharacterized membrane protein
VTVLLPETLRAGPRLLLPAVEGALLVALILGDPGRIDRRSARLRTLSVVLVAVLVASALVATGRLVDELIHGGAETDNASDLLAAGALTWTATILSFSLLYWELDAGGPAARAHGLPRYPDLSFPQQLDPALAPADWRPRYVDYLYLAFTDATALSPTDVMPLAAWAKIAMAVQSVISLTILGLVVARAVNIFS